MRSMSVQGRRSYSGREIDVVLITVRQRPRYGLQPFTPRRDQEWRNAVLRRRLVQHAQPVVIHTTV
jgi:hypothetical protein